VSARVSEAGNWTVVVDMKRLSLSPSHRQSPCQRKTMGNQGRKVPFTMPEGADCRPRGSPPASLAQRAAAKLAPAGPTCYKG
jgi:hypothetical protein